jgi:hypothetical protein
MHTWNRYRCQEFAKKHYIVVVKKAGAWGCWGEYTLPYVLNGPIYLFLLGI